MPAPRFQFHEEIPALLARREPPAEWAELWQKLAGAAGLGSGEPLLIALSGGADSVLLTCLAASARPRPPLVCVHVDHGLRGPESRADLEFCERLCRHLDVPLGVRRLVLDPRRSGLEARAREARYAALVEEARASGHLVILTGHHADDGLETLLMRWIRGTRRSGLAGLRARRSFRSSPDVSVVRPLLPLRRRQVKALLQSAGIGWREDSSNTDLAFRRNRVRHQLLPKIRDIGGERAVDNLFAFVGAVERLEQHLRRATSHLAWSPPAYARALPAGGPTGAGQARGGTLRRGDLMRLPPAVRRHALSHLLADGSGHQPSRALLAILLRDLEAGRCGRRSLPGGWALWLRSDLLHLTRPIRALSPPSLTGPVEAHGPLQLLLPFPPSPDEPRDFESRLFVPGTLTLPDGRRILAELLAPPRGRAVPRSQVEVELDADRLPNVAEGLGVRWPRSGDRFRGLGAPGSKSLRRFLSEAGIPLEERGRVPLVVAGGEIVWVAGVRPAERCRVRSETRKRVRLTLLEPECPAEGAPR